MFPSSPSRSISLLLSLLFALTVSGGAHTISESTRTSSAASSRVVRGRPNKENPSGAWIAGTVFFDADNDGIYDPANERPIEGATVLADARIARSAKDGSYSMRDVAAGSRSLLVIWPTGQRTRIGLEVDVSSRPVILNIGMNERIQAQGVRSPKAEMPARDSTPRTSTPSLPVSTSHFLSPSTGDGSPVRPTRLAVNVVNATTEETVEIGSPAAARLKSTSAAPSPLAPSAAMTRTAASRFLRGYSTGDGAIDGYIVDSSRRHNIDPLLIYVQMGQESGYKKRARSPKGASGLMQLMPATARRLGVADIYDPQQNIEGGVKYMRILMDMFHNDLRLVLAGYNAGEGAVVRYGNRIPPYAETQHYVDRISATYRALSSSSTGRARVPCVDNALAFPSDIAAKAIP
jgi:hypothetical protein